MITANRSGFRMLPAVSDNEIYAIGLVTLQWGNLEHFMDLLIAAANGGPYSSGKGSRASFVERARFLKSRVQGELADPWKSRLDKIISAALDIKGHRDMIVHGIWGEDQNGNKGVTEAKLIKPAERRMDYGRIRDFALKVDATNTALAAIIMQVGETYKRDPIMFEDAWTLMSKTTSA